MEADKKNHDLAIAEIKGGLDEKWRQISPAIVAAFQKAKTWLQQNNHLTHNEADDDTNGFSTAMLEASNGGTDAKRFAALESCLRTLRKKVGDFQ